MFDFCSRSSTYTSFLARWTPMLGMKVRLGGALAAAVEDDDDDDAAGVLDFSVVAGVVAVVVVAEISTVGSLGSVFGSIDDSFFLSILHDFN